VLIRATLYFFYIFFIFVTQTQFDAKLIRWITGRGIDMKVIDPQERSHGLALAGGVGVSVVFPSIEGIVGLSYCIVP
jgi:hypothetical protein